MSKDLQALLSQQFVREMEASYQYLAIAGYFESENLVGFAHWMKQQSLEERQHAMDFFAFTYDRGSQVTFAPISMPITDFSSPLEALAQALAQERMNTLAIKDLYGEAQARGEFELIEFLHSFIKEQIEEEASVGQVLADVQRAGGNGPALLFIDRELKKR